MKAKADAIAVMRPAQLSALLEAGAPVCVLDVREPEEWAGGHIAGALHIPMNDTPARLTELPRDRPIVCYCHHGMRSMAVAGYLIQNGFDDIHNLAGGIDAWSIDVDRKLPRY